MAKTPKKSPKKALGKATMKKTKGGHAGGVNVCLGDGSVRFSTDNGLLLPAVKNLQAP